VSIKSFPDYNRLLQENYAEYKHIFFTITITIVKNFFDFSYILKKKMFILHVVFL
jgi:hypothetical protein